jgi:virginiamycin B lyase
MTDFRGTPSSGPSGGWGITSGPDGNLWFTENQYNLVGMINPTTHAISAFSTPTTGSGPMGITAGPDGNVWFTENGASKIGVINPTTLAITEYATPTAGAGPHDITVGPDGNLWFTENGANKIGVINPTTHVISEFAVPTKKHVALSLYGITAGPDGNVWFIEDLTSKIGMISPTTHAITEYALPPGQPLEVVAGPDGNLWFGGSGGISKFNPVTHSSTQFALQNGAFGITVGPDGNIWFAENYASSPKNIGRINPTTGAITEYPVLDPLQGPRGITTGPDGNLWFNEHAAGVRIGVATLASSELVMTQQPTSVANGSPFSLTLQAEDSSGNLDTSFNGTVTVVGLAGNPGGVTLGGTLTVTAVNGVATFSGLTLNTTNVGSSYTLVIGGGGVGEAVSSPITVTAASAPAGANPRVGSVSRLAVRASGLQSSSSPAPVPLALGDADFLNTLVALRRPRRW